MTLLFDPYDPAVAANPYPAYRRLRDEDPVHYSEPLRAWVLTRYDHVHQCLNDRRLSADRITPYLARISATEREALHTVGPMLQKWAVFMDPPDHTRMRRLLNHGFTSTALAEFEPKVKKIVERMIDRLAARAVDGTEIDFIEEFAYPLPATVIAVMLGVPEADVAQFRAWSEDLAPFVGSATDTPDKERLAESAARALTEYFHGIIETRRKSPPAPEDVTVIDHMIAAEDSGDSLSLAELISNCVLLLFAGHETTTNLLGNGLQALMENPDQMALLAGRPELAESAVEEFLRYDGPVGSVARTVVDEVILDDTIISAGQRVFCMMGAANRDPDWFDDPDRLDVTRLKNRHVIFGYGIHFCVGAPLARMEGRYAFPALMAKLNAIEPGTAPPKWRDSFVLRGLESLPIRCRRT